MRDCGYKIMSATVLSSKLQLLQFRLEKWRKLGTTPAFKKLANKKEPLRKYSKEHEILESIVLDYSTFWKKMNISRSEATSTVLRDSRAKKLEIIKILPLMRPTSIGLSSRISSKTCF